MGLTAGTFNGTGADATGSDGDSNRVLTLLNTGLTVQSGFLVYASGLPLALTIEYTVVHNTTGTEITFLNGLWDDMTVVVSYFENLIGTANDFENGPLNDFGADVIRTPVTTTTNFSGQKTYSDGSTEIIKVVFSNPSQNFALDKSGLTEVSDAQMFTKQDQTINKYDKILYNGETYRVDKISLRKFNGTSMYKKVDLFLI